MDIKMGQSIGLGDFGTLNLSESTRGSLYEKASNILPGWVMDIMNPGQQEQQPIKPQVNPLVVGGIAVGALALVIIIASTAKKGGGRSRVVRRRRKRK